MDPTVRLYLDGLARWLSGPVLPAMLRKCVWAGRLAVRRTSIHGFEKGGDCSSRKCLECNSVSHSRTIQRDGCWLDSTRSSIWCPVWPTPIR